MLFLFGCGSVSEESDKIIDTVHNVVSAEMNLDFKVLLDRYNDEYKKVVAQTSDSVYLKDLHSFDSVFLNCVSFTDSLKKEVDKLDKIDPKSVELIKTIFIKQGVADTLFSKIKTTYELAESISNLTENKKAIKAARLRILNEPNTGQLKNHLFGLNNPPGVSMILYGFEYELFHMTDKVLINSSE